MIIENIQKKYKGVIIQLDTPEEVLMMYQIMYGRPEHYDEMLEQSPVLMYDISKLTGNKLYRFSGDVCNGLYDNDRFSPLRR